MIETITYCVDKVAPEKNVPSIKNENQWITNKIKKAIKKRDRLYQIWLDNSSTENRERYRQFRNYVTQVIRESKREENFRKLGNNPTAKTIYKTLMTVKKQQQPHSSLPDLEDLNKYFASIGSILSSNLPKVTNSDTIQQVENTMVVYPTNASEVTSIIKKMKNKKSCGEDGISNDILKCCSPIVDEYIAIAFNKCILEKTYPTCLKVAKVIPLHKKGDKSDPANYRPISLLSSLGKLFEKLLHKRMVKFCVKEKILTSTQFGFRSKRSCVDAISTVTEYIGTEIDRKSIGQICFIDLQKAFDTLDHNILLNKIEKYGFRGPIYHIVKSYLDNRWQVVASDCSISSKRRICTGVPQGSVLGSRLFLLYINDLHQVIKVIC